MKYDVFISYSSHDQKIVEGICGYLEARGIRCFVAYRDIPRGVVWASAIVDALDESSMMLVAFSESFNQSKQVDREIELASEDDKPILTFRLSESKFSGAKRYYLKNLNWIDAFPKPDNAFGELYKNICKLLGKEERTVSSSSNSSFGTQNQRPSLDVKKPQPAQPTSAPLQNRYQPSSSSHIPQKEHRTNSLESQLAFDPVKGEFKQKSDTLNGNNGNGFINGHEYVDLGLPSGLKWATCNVGALKPEEYGDYFAWGETKTKSRYTLENSETFKKDKQWLCSNGYMGGNGNLTLLHDVAQQNWGRTWRMPTLKEIEELVENTIKEWVIVNGVHGMRVKSKKNGNSIFLPAAGWHYGSSHNRSGQEGEYWSSDTPDVSVFSNESGYVLYFKSEYFSSSSSSRIVGRSVRPVSE